MELVLLAVRGKVREGVDLVRDEVYLVPGAHLHQLQGELPAVHRAQGVVGVTVEKPSDLLTKLSLGDDGFLQQVPTEAERLSVLLCETESPGKYSVQSVLTFKMNPDHLRLHSLLHVGEDASVGRDRGEDDLPGVGQDPAEGLQAGADSVNETEVSCGDENFSSRDSLRDKLSSS